MVSSSSACRPAGRRPHGLSPSLPCLTARCRCNGGVNFMLDWDQRGAFRLAALQSAAGRLLLQRAGRRPDDISSIVLVERDRCGTHSTAGVYQGQWSYGTSP